MGSRKKIVIKYGSKCVVNKVGLDKKRIEGFARELTLLRKQYDIIVVASGSVAFGKRIVLGAKHDLNDFDEQVLASIGSAGASEVWRLAFESHNILAGQLLITHREIDDSKEGSALMKAINRNIDCGVVIICNENDLLSDKELKKLAYGGDNDGLAAHLAVRLKAEALLLLTDVEGLSENNIIRRQLRTTEVESIGQYLAETNDEGTGSMESKLKAAAFATENGTASYIGSADASYKQILNGEVGTRIIL